MPRYALLAKSDWDHETPLLQDCPGVVLVSADRLPAWVHRLTGRASLLSNTNVARKLRNGERVYIAPDNRAAAIGLLVQAVSE